MKFILGEDGKTYGEKVIHTSEMRPANKVDISTM